MQAHEQDSRSGWTLDSYLLATFSGIPGDPTPHGGTDDSNFVHVDPAYLNDALALPPAIVATRFAWSAPGFALRG